MKNLKSISLVIVGTICFCLVVNLLWSFVLEVDAYSNTRSAAAALSDELKHFAQENGRPPRSVKELSSGNKISEFEEWIVYNHSINSKTCFIFWRGIEPQSDTLFISSAPVRTGAWRSYGRIAVKGDGTIYIIPESDFTEKIVRSPLFFGTTTP